MKLRTDNINALKENIQYEKEIVREASLFLNQVYILESLGKQGFGVSKEERKLLVTTINSLMTQLKLLNSSLSEIIGTVSFFREFPKEARRKIKKERLVSLKHGYPIKEGEGLVTIKKEDRLKFLRELNLAEISVRRLKKEYTLPREKAEEFKRPSMYAKISNKLFSKLSAHLIEKGYFRKIGGELRKSNLYFLSQTYISMALFSGLLALVTSVFLLIVLLFFDLGFIKYFWIVLALPALTLVLFYFYPSTEGKSIAGKINQELPFVVIHMSAIASSGIEPTKMFGIIVKSEEYPNTRKEIKKFLNEINIYGYDVVTALRTSARATPSARLAELFKGLATVITSGGNLKDFLDKRAESLIFNYRMEREKYNKTSETFMDVYISVVIAAPMIMTMLLVMISLTGIPLGLSLGVITLLLLLGITLINVLFLIFLHSTQPKL